MLPISYLFVPGDRPDRFAKAMVSGADAVVSSPGARAAGAASPGWTLLEGARSRVMAGAAAGSVER